jgi:hypothetical protein
MVEEIQEEWKAVVGWEGVYEVSALGRVRSIKPAAGYKTPRVKKPQIGSGGYEEHSLWCNGSA